MDERGEGGGTVVHWIEGERVVNPISFVSIYCALLAVCAFLLVTTAYIFPPLFFFTVLTLCVYLNLDTSALFLIDNSFFPLHFTSLNIVEAVVTSQRTTYVCHIEGGVLAAQEEE